MKKQRPKVNYTIVETLDEDTCIIDVNTKEKTGRKIISFDDLEAGRIVWDADLIAAELSALEKKERSEQAQKLAQMNGGKH